MQPQQPKFAVTVDTSQNQFKGVYIYQQNEQITHITTQISNHCKIYKNERTKQYYFKIGENKLSADNRFICQLDCENYPNKPSYWLRFNKQITNYKNKPYLVLDSKNNKRLVVGDIFKVGSTSFRVIDLGTKYYLNQPLTFSNSVAKQFGQIYKVQLQNKEENHNLLNQHSELEKEQNKLTIGQSSGKQKYYQHTYQLQNEIRDQCNQLGLVQQPKNTHMEVQPTTFLKPEKLNTQEPINCKICMSDEQEQGDPLISPCQCKGSCKLIHLRCLKAWIESNTKKTTKKEVCRYKLINQNCQICKSPFPKLIEYKGIRSTLLDFYTTTPRYMLLQCFDYGREQQQKCYFVIPAQYHKIIRIGREPDNQIRITDRAVSRRHAQIQYREGEFYLRDLSSKYGTLLELRNDHEFLYTQKVKMQINRTLFTFRAIFPDKHGKYSNFD